MARFDIERVPPGTLAWDPDNAGVGYRRRKSGRGGSWVIRYWVTLPDGTRTRVGPEVVHNAQNRLQAIGVLRAKQGEAFQNFYTAKRRVPTLEDFTETFLRAKAELAIVETYRAQLERKLQPALGAKTPLSLITTADCERYNRQRLAEGAAPATARNELRCLQSLFVEARKARIVTHDPVRDVDFGAIENERARVLLGREAELADSAAAAARGYIRPLWFMLRFTGFRIAHALRLRWDDEVDVGAGFVRTQPDKHAREVTVPLLELLRDELRRWRRLTPHRQSPWVFPSRVGKGHHHMAAAGSIRKAWGALTDKAQLVDFTPHDVRRTFITRLAATGASEKQIAAFTGHRSVGIVGRYEQPSQLTMLELLERAFGHDPSAIHPVRTSCTSSRATTEQPQQ